MNSSDVFLELFDDSIRAELVGKNFYLEIEQSMSFTDGLESFRSKVRAALPLVGLVLLYVPCNY